jgi:acetyl-CoA carboxylase carboxyl transferase subunit alpha
MARETEAHLRGRLGRLKNLGLLRGASISGELSRLERQLEQTAEPTDEEIWQRVELARHADRPYTLDYVERVFDDFIELHGDRSRAEDPAMIAGLGRFNGRTVALLGQQKGRDTKERLRRNYGMTYPEGYRKAMRTMDLAERHRFPIVSLVDTPGAFPGVAAEQHGQGGAIARSQALMSRLTIPIVACVIGEGGSGGAIAIALADRVLMQENAMYSVISPEGCAAILWRDGAEKVKAAAALKPDAVHTLELGVIDAIVPEPAGGAHTNWDEAAKLLGEALQSSLDDLSALTGEELRRRRRDRFRSLGVYSSSTASTDSTGLSTEAAATRK